jgi:diaminohydroxyphosphoribosylaminopyrimidine deaminase / 5-amino-6-(5-phosphoribosylamino)uracil reductase
MNANEKSRATDDAHMARAIAAAAEVRASTSPNPWVGAVLVAETGDVFAGATVPPGGPHAEIVAIERARSAGAPTEGATLHVTLEPCCHWGRTPPCTDAIVEAGIARVVVGIEDPDPQVHGKGVGQLRAAGVAVDVGVRAAEIEAQLAPYLKHRTTGRPWVVLKLAATLDGRTAAPDGTSRWITGPDARADAHRLRAESDAVIVGAGTVRVDDPSLTVRHVPGRDPLRVVLGEAPLDARVRPALELSGELTDVLDELGRRGVVQALVEGGPTVAGRFHREGLVDRYVVYLAPALFGGNDAPGLFAGPGASSIDGLWRGRIANVERLGADLRIDLEPAEERDA